MIRIFLILLLATSFCSAEVKVRPGKWGQQIIGSSLENWYKFDDKLYRSEQPDEDAMKELEAFGIKNILNLRNHHDDNDEAEGRSLTLQHIKMNAGSITEQHIIKALKVIKASKGPVLVHCWHGSDRTGTICAAYRIAIQEWSVEDAVDELVNGGYGYHSIYKNIPKLLKSMNWADLKKKL